MRPVLVVVLAELRDCLPQVPLTDWNDAIETFFFDRPYKSLGVRVRVGRALGDPHHVDARVPEPTPDIMAPFPIPIADQDLRWAHDTRLHHRQRPDDLLHEQRLRMRRGS